MHGGIPSFPQDPDPKDFQAELAASSFPQSGSCLPRLHWGALSCSCQAVLAVPGCRQTSAPVGGLPGRESRAQAAAPGGCLGLLHYLIPNLQYPRAERTRTEGPSGILPWLPSPSPPAQLGDSGDKGRAELCSLHVEVCRSLSAAPRITTPHPPPSCLL